MASCDLCPGKAEHHFEWNVLFRCWTKNEVMQPSAQQLEANNIDLSITLPVNRSLCNKCHRRNPYSCTDCRSSDFLTPGKSVELKRWQSTYLHGIPCRCGGTASKCAGPLYVETPELKRKHQAIFDANAQRVDHEAHEKRKVVEAARVEDETNYDKEAELEERAAKRQRV